jgi:hypothetical protein
VNSQVPGFPGDGQSGGELEEAPLIPAFVYTNGFWMFIEHDTNSLSLTLHGTEENRRYQILSKTNLNEPLWHIEQEVTGALETNATLATVPMADRPDLFLWAISTPHNLRMALSSLYTHSGLLTANIEGGPASSIGFLVNSTNFAEATWIPYAEAVNIPLLNGDGDYEIWIGFVGAGAVTNWSMSRVVLDTVAPQIVITNPQPGTVSRSVISIAGLQSRTFEQHYLRSGE